MNTQIVNYNRNIKGQFTNAPRYEMRKRATLICICGNRFEVRAHRLATNKRLSCSRSCANTLKFTGKKKAGHSQATKRKISLKLHEIYKNSEDHPHWEGGKTSERERLRRSWEYRQWRQAVYKRDDYTCQECGVKGVKINADHIKPWSLYPELRFDINNGRVLCVPCHKKTPSYLNNHMTI
jgi:5-methylcytosine-specific restriction endonuclease McrA